MSDQEYKEYKERKEIREDLVIDLSILFRLEK